MAVRPIRELRIGVIEQIVQLKKEDPLQRPKNSETRLAQFI